MLCNAVSEMFILTDNLTVTLTTVAFFSSSTAKLYTYCEQRHVACCPAFALKYLECQFSKKKAEHKILHFLYQKRFQFPVNLCLLCVTSSRINYISVLVPEESLRFEAYGAYLMSEPRQ